MQTTFPTSDTILHQAEDTFEQIAGLPTDEHREKSMVVVTDGAPSTKLYYELNERYGRSHVVFIYSLSEVRGFRHFIPSTFYRIASTMPASLLPEGIDVDPAARILQVMTELNAKISTIDSAIVNERRDLETVVSRVRQYLRLSNLMKQFGVDDGANAEMFHPFVASRNDEILTMTKQRMIALYETMDWRLKPVPSDTLVGNLSESERRKFGYTEWLKDRLGDNLEGIVAYGSSTQFDDPAMYGDYDNWLIVRDIAKAHRVLAATHPHYDLSTGSVVSIREDEAKKDPSLKHLGLLLLTPGKLLDNYLRSLHDVDEFRNTVKVLYGDLALPRISSIECIEKGRAHAYSKAKTLAGAVTLFWDRPEKLTGKPALFDYFCKNMRFFYKHALKGTNPEFLKKDEIDRRLLENFGMTVPQYQDDPLYVRDALVYSRIATAYLQETTLSDVVFDGSYFQPHISLGSQRDVPQEYL